MFNIGDRVWLFTPKRKKGVSPKLQRNWDGPFVILKKVNDVTFRIQKSPRSKPKVVHHDRLKLYTGKISSPFNVKPNSCDVSCQTTSSEKTGDTDPSTKTDPSLDSSYYKHDPPISIDLSGAPKQRTDTPSPETVLVRREEDNTDRNGDDGKRCRRNRKPPVRYGFDEHA